MAPTPVTLQVAAFLHDIGHLLDVPIDPACGNDDRHEIVGSKWLKMKGFPDSVTVPIAQHVNAKRYMCYKYTNYESKLSKGSSLSLALQGGLMHKAEAQLFEKIPHFQQALLLRHCDDNSKVIGMTDLPDLDVVMHDVLFVLIHSE